MSDLYKEKYLKYKIKYTKLKKSITKMNGKGLDDKKLEECQFEYGDKIKDELMKKTLAKLREHNPKSEQDKNDLVYIQKILLQPNILINTNISSNSNITTSIRKMLDINNANYKDQLFYLRRELSYLLFSFDDGIIYPNNPINNMFRSMLSTLINKKIINIGFNCADTSKFLSGTKLPKNSNSQTVQFSNINVQNITDFFKISINKDNLDSLIDNILAKYDEKNKCNDKDKLKIKIEENILKIINNLKKNFFLKVGSYEGSKICDASKINYDDLSNINASEVEINQYDVYQKNELYFYKLLTNFVFNNNTPHVATYIYDLLCKENENEEFIKDLKMLDRPGKLGYINMLTEMMEDSQSLQNIYDSKNYDLIKEIICNILFQILYTLFIFEKQLLIHNDLHPGNIMIETLEKPFTYYYVMSNYDDTDNKTIIKHTSKYFVRIYDFDRSFIINDDKYENLPCIAAEPVEPKELVDCLKDRFKDNIKEDITRLTSGIKKTMEDYKKEKDITWMNELKFNEVKLNKELVTSKYIENIITNIPICLRTNIEVVDNISNIKLTNETCIFFPQTANIGNLLRDIHTNESWNKLSLKDKLLICHPLVIASDLDGPNGLQDLSC